MPKIAQAGNRYPYRLIDAPWKVATAATVLSEIITLVVVYGFSGFIPTYVPILVLLCAFGTVYPINVLLFRLIKQNDEQRLRLQTLAQTLQATNQQLTTHQQRLQTQRDDLEQQNQALNTFAHTLAHDLKNLLAVVVQNNDLLLYYTEAQDTESRSGVERLQRAASRSHQAALQLAKIVDAVLLFAGISAQPHAPIAALSMATILFEAQKRLSQLITTHQAEVTIATTWPGALGYAPWVEEIWVNYMENAIKYGGHPPRLVIGGEKLDNDFVQFWVQDNGPGLTREEQSRLFVEFTQLKRLDQSNYGLGLTITKHIAEKLGGRVGIESEIGQGSRFYFTLPAAPEGTPAAHTA